MGRWPSAVGAVQFASWGTAPIGNQPEDHICNGNTLLLGATDVLPQLHRLIRHATNVKFVRLRSLSSFPTISSLLLMLLFLPSLSSSSTFFLIFFFPFLFIIICMLCSVHHRCDTEHEKVPRSSNSQTHNLSFLSSFCCRSVPSPLVLFSRKDAVRS